MRSMRLNVVFVFLGVLLLCLGVAGAEGKTVYSKTGLEVANPKKIRVVIEDLAEQEKNRTLRKEPSNPNRTPVAA